MTAATHANLDARLSAGVERAWTGLAGRLVRTMAERRDYRRALAELGALDIRQREDLGIAGLDMRDVARAALRRK